MKGSDQGEAKIPGDSKKSRNRHLVIINQLRRKVNSHHKKANAYTDNRKILGITDFI